MFCSDVTGIDSIHTPSIQICSTLFLNFVSFALTLVDFMSMARHAQQMNGCCWALGLVTYIDQSFPDLLTDCLCLQRVVHGIKHCQGTPSSSQLPITDDLMLVIWQSLVLDLPDYQMFWAACSLRYFGFLQMWEFTVPNLSALSASLHLSIQDIEVNSSSALSSMHILIKGSKTDLFRKGCSFHVGLGRHPLCAVQAMMSYLTSRGDAPGALFLFRTG